MSFHSYVPPEPLSEFVDLMWIVEGFSASHAQERVLPTEAMDLVIGLSADDCVGAVMAGARSQSFVLDTSKPLSLIGVRFGVVTGQIGLSSRHFAQVFRDQVGLTPKLFCRIKRFQRVLDMLERPGDIDWPDVALRCGYFDQAHFIHDFRSFSGITPTAYMLHRTHRHHVAID